MRDPRITTLARNLVNHSCKVRPGDRVLIENTGLETGLVTALVEQVVDRVLAANPQSVTDFRGGKEKAFGFLVGQVMRELKGKADPKLVNALLRQKLAE